MDEMRDRLITALRKDCASLAKCDGCSNACNHIKIKADRLMAAGVILPKFSTGQEVWAIFDLAISDRFCGWLKEEREMYSGKIVKDIVVQVSCNTYESEKTADVFHTKFLQLTFSERQIGKIYFATEAEARAALEGEK